MGRLRNLLKLPFAKPQVALTPSDCVHKENKWQLLRYKARPDGIVHKRAVLLVPSLINRHYVLDLAPEKSFVEYLVAQGHDVFIIDWGNPGREDRHLSLDDYADRYIGRAVRVAERLSGESQVHLLGYCLGGILTTMHIARRPERIASHVAIAAPIRFDDDGILTVWTQSEGFEVSSILDAFGNVPSWFLQSSFHMMKPTLAAWKAVNVIDRADNEEFLAGFAATEHWGRDNIDFPGHVFSQLINDIYRDDGFVNETLSLSGKMIRLSEIETPTLVVSFEHDYIVPKASATAMLDMISSPCKENLHLNGGHVGAVISRKAKDGLWPKLSTWWQARDAAEARDAQGLRVN